MKLHIALAASLLLCLTSEQTVQGYSAILNKADHTEVRIVPAPGKVTIDGDLKDWDLSGAILMFIDEASKETHQLRGAMMYDKEWLYVGGRLKDPTPMMNQYHFGGQVNAAWNADALQINLVANPNVRSDALTMTGGRMPEEEQKFVNFFWLWHSTRDKKAGYFSLRTLKFTEPTLNPPGVQGMWVKNEDGKGCTFEYRIPWKVLYAAGPMKGGDAIQMIWQLHWGNDQGTELKTGINDVRNPNSNALGYMGPGGWGLGRFMAEGNLPPAEREGVQRAEGHIPVRFTLEKDAKVSISIRDAAGRTVRTGIGAVPYKAGEHAWLWDGLDDRDNPLPAGTYTAMILTHDGIGQKYVCDVGMSGDPPYQTEDGTGGWAGDYWEPWYVAIEDDCVILGSCSHEAQKPAIRTDLEGRKQYGTSALGHVLTLRKGFGYFLAGNRLQKFALKDGKLSPFKSGQPEATVPGGGGIRLGLAAIDDDTLAVGDRNGNKIYLLDIETAETKGEVDVPAPIGLAADSRGTLYAVSSSAVVRVDVKKKTLAPIAEGLDSPSHLACDAAGNVYVSLIGETMQVWKLSPSGKVLFKYGKAGGRPRLGPYDPSGMLNPFGIAVDRNGRLWVCENDREPKRYSVWNPDGSLYKEFFGSWPYSTAGYFDPADPKYFYALSVRYVVDYETGAWKTDANILRPELLQPPPERGSAHAVDVHGGGQIVSVQGRKFLYVNSRRLFEEVKGAWVPRAAIYGKGDKQFWLDGNNDGKVQDEECPDSGARFAKLWKSNLDAHLNWYTLDGDGWTEPRAEGRCTTPFAVMRLDFLGFAPNGALRYADAARPVVQDAEGGSVNGIAVDPDGSVYVLVSGGLVARGERAQGTGARIVKYGPDGKELWRYANVHCGFAWTSATYTPGFVVAGFRCSSWQHPDLLPVTGYYGQYFLIDKRDGLFVDALCQDQRSAYTIDHTFVATENFNGNIFKHPKTGKTYFTGGDCDCRIWELTGLDSIRRHKVSITMPKDMAEVAAKNGEQNKKAQVALLARNSGRKTAGLRRLTGAAADGRDTEWQGVPALALGDDKGKPAQVQIGYEDKNLYARFQVTTGVPFRNTPTDYRLLFKSGSALELCLTPHTANRQVKAHNVHPMEVGDLRIVLARTADGRMVATRYRPKTKNGKKPFAAYFETQAAGRESFDEIAEWNDLPMHYREVKGGYVVEVAVPWSATEIEPKAGLRFLFDAGVIYGNEGGNRNASSALWSDRTPEVGVNNDIPTECRLHPNGWGLVVME